jgi:hypothetical protein
VKLRDESVLVGMKSMAVGVAVRGDAMDPVTIELSVDDILAPPFIVKEYDIMSEGDRLQTSQFVTIVPATVSAPMAKLTS